MMLNAPARAVLRQLIASVLDQYSYPTKEAVARIAFATGTDETDVYYALKRLRMLGLEPTPNLTAILPR
jgi:hypothetical protein